MTISEDELTATIRTDQTNIGMRHVVCKVYADKDVLIYHEDETGDVDYGLLFEDEQFKQLRDVVQGGDENDEVHFDLSGHTVDVVSDGEGGVLLTFTEANADSAVMPTELRLFPGEFEALLDHYRDAIHALEYEGLI